MFDTYDPNGNVLLINLITVLISIPGQTRCIFVPDLVLLLSCHLLILYLGTSWWYCTSR